MDVRTGARVSSAVISLNGAVVVGPQAFSQAVTEISRPVALGPSNQLSVELRGTPGGLIVLDIVGRDDAHRRERHRADGL